MHHCPPYDLAIHRSTRVSNYVKYLVVGSRCTKPCARGCFAAIAAFQSPASTTRARCCSLEASTVDDADDHVVLPVVLPSSSCAIHRTFQPSTPKQHPTARQRPTRFPQPSALSLGSALRPPSKHRSSRASHEARRHADDRREPPFDQTNFRHKRRPGRARSESR
jgi:hypothetical protein